MSTRTYTDQLRNGLKQARDRLIAAKEHAEGEMNTAQAKLVEQTSDASARAAARTSAVSRAQVMHATHLIGARSACLANAAHAAAGSADASATRLISALETAGRAIRGCVEAKDDLLREIDGVAGIARNHLRHPGQKGPVRDPLSALADHVSEVLSQGGAAVERMQQSVIRSNIAAAQSQAAAANEHWREAASALETVAKHVTVALEDANTVVANTVGSSAELQAARFATWEKLNEGDAAVLAHLEGLQAIDQVVNGRLVADRQNHIDDRGQRAGFKASYTISLPDAALERAAGSDGKEGARPELDVAFFAVPTQSATGFSRSGAEDALAAGAAIVVKAGAAQAEGEGGAAWTYSTPSREPITKDAFGNRLEFGTAYTIFAAEVEPRPVKSGSRRSAASSVARLSLPSLPLTAALTFAPPRKPGVFALPENAFVVRFENVTVEGSRAAKLSLEDAVSDYRLLVVPKTVWESWEGRLHRPRNDDPKALPAAEAGKAAGEAKSVAATTGAAAKATRLVKDARTDDLAALPEDALERRLRLARELRIAAMLNEADWTTLQPGSGLSASPEAKQLDRFVAAIGERFRSDMAHVPGISTRELADKDRDELRKFLAAPSAAGSVVCYFNPFAADTESPVVPVGRYSDIRGELLDFCVFQYVAVVYVAGKRQDEAPRAQDVISEASEPFPKLPPAPKS